MADLAGVPASELRAELERRDHAESFVGVCCMSGLDCHTGGYFPDEHGSAPIDDDGREFVYDDTREWVCARCATELEFVRG